MPNGLTFFDHVCSNADKFAILLALECLAGIVSIAVFIGTEAGTAAHAVAILDLIGVSVLGTCTTAILLKCYRV